MPKFAPGQPKHPKSGRRKGSVTRLTLLARHKLEELGCDPVAEMVKLANDRDTPLELRVKLFSELANYCYPKLKATDHQVSGIGGGPIEIDTGSAKEKLLDRLREMAESFAPEQRARILEDLAAEKSEGGGPVQ